MIRSGSTISAELRVDPGTSTRTKSDLLFRSSGVAAEPFGAEKASQLLAAKARRIHRDATSAPANSRFIMVKCCME